MRWHVRRWFNVDGDLSLDALRGRVVVVHTFQMLCPACVLQGIPQAKRIRAAFPEREVAVVGLHTVFEHHAAMSDVSLEAFLHEYRVAFPVGVDAHALDETLPMTMKAWELRGTPSTVIFDRGGKMAHRSFGAEEDLRVGAAVARLVAAAPNCDTEGCVAPRSVA